MSTTEVDDREQTAGEGQGEVQKEKPRLSLEVKVEKPSACQRHVVVSIAKEDVQRYVKEAFDELMPKAEIRGFRPGHAPRKLIERQFKEHVGDQVKGKLLMDSLTQMGDDHEFTAISEPDFDMNSIQLPDDGPMVFEFDIEVRPEFDLPRWKGLKLNKPVHEYSDAEVDERLRLLLAKYGRLEAVERPIQAGDFVTLTLRATSGGEQISQLTEETIEVRPTLSLLDARLEGFDKLLIGKNVGDTVETKITVSEESDSEAYRGKEVDLSMEIVALEERRLPELSQAFLEKIGGFKDEDELRAEVRKELERQLRYYQQKQVREQITAQLTITATWDLPKELLRKQAGREMERAIMELQSAGFPDEAIRAHQNELRQNAHASTARALKEHFILERIAEDEKIEANDDDYDREVELIAEQADESPRKVRARLEKRGLMDTLRNQIVERKAIELIEQNADFIEKPYTPPKETVVAVHYAVAGHAAEAIPNAEHDEGDSPTQPGKTA
ncbi:MAG TPA: trigger factor [Pirellulaceae bacterium]|nr:trigger factor [Pirellulaceae bacterium]